MSLGSNVGGDLGLESGGTSKLTPTAFAAGTRQPPMILGAWATLPAELPAPLGVIAPVTTVVAKGTRAPGVAL